MKRYKIAAVLFDRFEMLDLYGPLEMYFGDASLFQITTIAQTMDPVRASGGPCTVPEDTFEQGHDYDILLVPGGAGTRDEVNNPAMITWLQEAAPKAEVVTSVCTGSALLAKAGLLDGHKATTNKLWFDETIAVAPHVNWIRRARWVESGKFFTSSGVSAGMDMTLAVIEKLAGTKAADHAALEAEYIRNRDPDNDPFAID